MWVLKSKTNLIVNKVNNTIKIIDNKQNICPLEEKGKLGILLLKTNTCCDNLRLYAVTKYYINIIYFISKFENLIHDSS